MFFHIVTVRIRDPKWFIECPTTWIYLHGLIVIGMGVVCFLIDPISKQTIWLYNPYSTRVDCLFILSLVSCLLPFFLLAVVVSFPLLSFSRSCFTYTNHLFTYWFNVSFVSSFICFFIHLFLHSFIHSFIHSFVCSSIYSSICYLSRYLFIYLIFHLYTPPKFNIAPEKRWLENYVPIGKAPFQGLC